VEVEFYSIFPLIWWCFKRQPWMTAVAMILIAGLWRAGLAQCCYSSLFTPYEENLPGYLDIFAFGMLAAYLFTRFGDAWRGSRFRYAAPFVALGGFALLVVLLESLYAYRFHDQWAGVWQIDNRPLLGAAFAVVALGSLVSPRWWRSVLDNAPLRFMATISYNLYLYHQVVARELLWHHFPSYTGNPHEDQRWKVRYTEAAFAIAIAQAAVVTFCFERPLLQIRLKDVAR
jgi:peptidoglycan/LPS O-acetylase OafA/YrhL